MLAYALPHSLPGFDIAAAQKRLGGNGRLLADLLGAFATEHPCERSGQISGGEMLIGLRVRTVGRRVRNAGQRLGRGHEGGRARRRRSQGP